MRESFFSCVPNYFFDYSKIFKRSWMMEFLIFKKTYFISSLTAIINGLEKHFDENRNSYKLNDEKLIGWNKRKNGKNIEKHNMVEKKATRCSLLILV